MNATTASAPLFKVALAAGLLWDAGIAPALAQQASALKFEHAGTTLTFGTSLRASGRDADLIPAPSAGTIGAFGRAPGGQNADDGNLNFERGDKVSTVLKIYTGLNIKYEDTATARVRVKAWHDFTLEEHGVPWGNLSNGYTANASLSDAGFHRLTKFSGIALMDAHIDFHTSTQSGLLRLGNQTIDWGNRSPAITIRGGLDQVNALDLAAMARPGALPEEQRIPAAAAFAKLDVVPKHLSVEGFYQFRFEPNQIPGCGTFNSLVDYAAEGCNRLLVGTFNDRLALANGLFANRAPDRNPPHGGQYGLGAKYLSPVGLFGLYYANIHSRRWVPSPLKSTRVGPPLIPGDPGNANVRYFVEYPEDTRLLGLNYGFATPDGTGLYAELTHLPNQPVRLNGTDLLNAFASNVAPTLLRADATATAPGAAYSGYDRLKITQLTVSGRKPLGNLLGASAFTVSGEAGIKHIHDLPDATLRRYGRPDAFGIGPVVGACAGTAVQCSNAGYTTATSWGYRIKGEIMIPEVVPGWRATPALAFGHDVKGWSHDEDFSEGRKALIASLRADHKSGYFAEIRWASNWGGTYNIYRDRDVLTAFIGMTFDPPKKN